jgi:predicted ATPase
LYDTLDEAERCYLHEAVGNALEQLYGEQTEEVAAQLAQHFELAGLVGKAIEYLRRAGERAVQLSANEEAIRYLTKGVALLESLPATPERAQQELRLQVALGVPLIATKGWAAPEVEKVYARARALCQQVGDTPQLVSALWGLHSFYIVRLALRTARELREQCLQLLQVQGDPTLPVAAHFMPGALLYHLGELIPARAHLEQGIGFYDSQQHRFHILLYGVDLGVFCLSYASHVLWYLGYPNQALQRSYEAVALARELAHPLSLALAEDYAAMLHQFRRERQVAQAQAAAALALCTKHGFAYYLGWGTIMQGWALAEQGEMEQGMIHMRQGLADLRAMGARMRQPYYLALLAEAYGKAGQAEEGLRVLAEALATVEETDERFYEAELHRLKGELLLLLQDEAGDASPEACFHQAIAVARRQGATSLELRAAMSLSRLWQRQGKKEKARQLLAEIYNWFSEGFDTADLKEAKALLEAVTP